MNMRLAPAAFLDSAHLENYSYEVRDGILTISSVETKARLDAATGRPLMIESKKPNGYSFRMQTEVDALSSDKNNSSNRA